MEGEVCGLAEQKGLQMPRGSNTRQKLLSESTVDRSTGLAGSLGLFVDAVPGLEGESLMWESGGGMLLFKQSQS